MSLETPQQVEESRSVTGSVGDGSGSPETTRSAPRWVWFLLLIGLVAIAGTLAEVMLQDTSSAAVGDPDATYTVTRGELLVTVTETGTVESSRNTEIKCEIRGGYGGRGGRSTVTWVVSNGTTVKAGDELVRLDTKNIEETVSLGKTDTNIAKAALARTRTDVAIAQVATDGYLNGEYRSQMTRLRMKLSADERNVRHAKAMLAETESLFVRGFANELQVKAAESTIKQAELELKVTDTEMDVLQRLTRKMQLERRRSQLIATRERLAGREAGVVLEQSRLDLAMEEFERCVITAPQGGLVIYPSTAKWKRTPDITDGASVHNNQVLLLMPDLTRMQVKIRIHESIVDRVHPGTVARVELPDRTLDTKISSVSVVARPAGWWDGNIVKYDSIIELHSIEGLRPGMSAKVELVVARHKDVLSVPLSAVVETDQGQFCWVESVDGPQRCSVTLGDSNDRFVVVLSGLQEQQRVVVQPLASVADARALLGSKIVHTVKRGTLPVTMIEQGALESFNNTQVKCRVRGDSTINWVIKNGTWVEAGDELVTLENKAIEEYLHERTKFAHLSKDAAIGFRADATVTGLAISKYLEGEFRTQKLKFQKALAFASQRLHTANNMLDYARRMHALGYQSELRVEQSELSLQNAQIDLEIMETNLDVLERLEKEKELLRLKGEWESAKAAAKGHEEVLAMDSERMALAVKEIARCVIKAPKSGLVIFPSTAQWKDTPDIAKGETVHNDQVLLLMPDLSKMQVRFGIHESAIGQVEPKMHVTVRLPNQTLSGTVSSVASVAQPKGWWTGNIVKYDALVELPSVEGLKPGMTAEIEVTVARREDVLMIPISAVEETDAGDFCWVRTRDGNAHRRPLTLGDRNAEFIAVDSGIEEGDQVFLNPSLTVKQPRKPSAAVGSIP